MPVKAPYTVIPRGEAHLAALPKVVYLGRKNLPVEKRESWHLPSDFSPLSFSGMWAVLVGTYTGLVFHQPGGVAPPEHLGYPTALIGSVAYLHLYWLAYFFSPPVEYWLNLHVLGAETPVPGRQYFAPSAPYYLIECFARNPVDCPA